MPIYGYRCESCGHQLEVLQKISDEPLKVCPNCQGKLTKKLYPAGVIFKGSGFYSTDYKGSGKGAANGSTPSSGDKTESKPESKTETKSESKSDSGD